MIYNINMRKEKTLLVIGLWVLILPFLGFSINSKKVLFVITGFAILYLGYLFYLEARNRLLKISDHSKTFVDNIGSGE